jgi:pimeloyl-ACP methyl ester carboxylesterase
VRRAAAFVAAMLLTGCGGTASRHSGAFCSGSGSPTVVLVPGLGATHAAWRDVQPRIARFTRACSYNRLPASLDLDPPLVLVGHSLGGVLVRLYAAAHPREVAGVVLVDSLHPRMRERFHLNRPAPAVATAFAKARKTRSLGDTRLVVIQAGREISETVPPRQRFALNRAWSQLQADLAGLSSDHIHVIAATSGHDIPRDQPDVVVTAVRGVVDAARRRTQLPPCERLFARVAAQCFSGPSP